MPDIKQINKEIKKIKSLMVNCDVDDFIMYDKMLFDLKKQKL